MALVPGAEKTGDVVGLVLEADVIVGVARSEQFIADPLAIDSHLIKSPR